VKNAGSAMPGIGQWVAPTLNPEELEKRIAELRTVQYWLEQNARMLGATIQALEVQRMTLSTLKAMNVQMSDLRDSLTIAVPTAAPDTPQAAPAAAAGSGPASAAAVDPMQWWGAITKQFTELATSAMKEGAAGAAAKLAGVAAGHPPAATVKAPRQAAARAAAQSRSAAPRKRSASR
jgi:hypothetical protein